jgi:LysM repeat protein
MFVKIVIVAVATAFLVSLAARGSSGAGQEQTYVVRPTDTLWSIAAAHYGGDPREGVWRLERRNHLQTPLVRPGQRLVLP